MPDKKTALTKKSAAKRKSHGPAAMTAANSKRRRAGNGRHTGDRPKAAGNESAAYSAKTSGDDYTGTKQGHASDAHVKKFDVDKAPGAAKQATVKNFAFGYSTKHGGLGGKERPTASTGVNKPINFGGLGEFDPSRMRAHSNMKLGGAGMHAT